MYVFPLGDVVRKHGINFHMYADDVQLYVSFRPCDQKKALHELQHCLDDVHSWLRENRLLLNGNKTKMITFGTKQRLTVATNIHVTVDGCFSRCNYKESWDCVRLHAEHGTPSERSMSRSVPSTS